MLTRIVQMSFRADTIPLFLAYLPQYQQAIRQSDGCTYLQILQDPAQPTTIFTYSRWDSADHLEAYRQSPLFQTVWSQVRQWFADKPRAWSLDTLCSLD